MGASGSRVGDVQPPTYPDRVTRRLASNARRQRNSFRGRGPARRAPEDEAFAQEYAIQEAAAEETVTAAGAGPARGPGPGVGRALAGGTAWQTLAQLVPVVINLGFTPYFIVGLGHDRYSIFLLVNTITMLLAQFDGGLGQASMRFFTLYAGSGDRAAATRLLTSVSAVFAAGTTVVFGSLFLAAPALLRFFGVSAAYFDETTLLLRVLVVLLAFILIRNLYNSLLFAHARFRITSTAIIAGYLVYVAGMILTIRADWGLRGVAATFVAQQLVGALISVPAGLRYVDRRGVGWMDRAVAREFFGYAWKVQITGLIAMASAQKDQLVAGRMLGAQLSGPYGQGANFTQNLKMMPLNAFGPLQAMIGQRVGAEGAEAARQTAERIQRVWVRALVGYGAVGLPATYYGVATWLRDSFGPTSAPVATVLFAGAVVAMLGSVLNMWCLTLGQPGLSLRSSLIGLTLNVVLSIVGWVTLGMLGVVAGTAAAQVGSAAWLSWAAPRKLGTPIEWFGRSIPWGWAAAAAAVTLGLEVLVHSHLPRGAAGLLACGLLAAPGFLGYLVAVFGVAQLREAARRVPGVRRLVR